MTTFVMNRMLCGKKYSLAQFVLIFVITLGAASATFAEALSKSVSSAVSGTAAADCTDCGDRPSAQVGNALNTLLPSSTAADAANESAQFFTWLIGICVLFAVLILQSLLSLYQNFVADKFGRAAEESMLYTHAMSLVPFIFTISDMQTRSNLWNQSPPTADILTSTFFSEGSNHNPIVGIIAWATLFPLRRLPVMWTYVILNAISQYVCVIGVYNLVTMTDPLTVNVTLTVRKCASLLLSIYLFNNSFTLLHWIGASCVFGGALAYSLVPAPSVPVKPKLESAAAISVPAASSAQQRDLNIEAGSISKHRTV
jgi:drug/metabolite transporter (DMT)-like permease